MIIMMMSSTSMTSTSGRDVDVGFDSAAATQLHCHSYDSKSIRDLRLAMSDSSQAPSRQSPIAQSLLTPSS